MRAECNSIIVSFHELAKIAFSLCDAKNSTDGIFRSALKPNFFLIFFLSV